MMQELVRYFRIYYFIDPFTVLTALAGIWAIERFKAGKGELQLFRSYFLFYILLKAYAYASICMSASRLSMPADQVCRHLDFYFTVFEYFVFALYFRKRVHSAVFYSSTLFFSATAVTIYFLLPQTNGRLDCELLFLYQCVALIPVCISYYVTRFRTFFHIPVVRDPGFWIATGLTSYVLATLPYSIILPLLVKYYVRLYVQFYVLFFIFYIVLFLFIIKAVRCGSSMSQDKRGVKFQS